MTLRSLFIRTFVIMISSCLIVSSASAQYAQDGNKLTVAGGQPLSYHGFSVSLSTDGNTAIAGAYGETANAGGARIYARVNGQWVQQGGRLLGANAIGASRQGISVAMSGDGKTAIVGGYYDSAQTGAAWIYALNGGVWSQQGPKLVGTGAVGAAMQGFAVSLSESGSTAIIGGYADSGEYGATWVFIRTGSVWSQQGSKLVGTGGGSGSDQGCAVDLSADGNTAIIGAVNDNGSQGATWVFTRTGSVWSQQGAKLVGTGVSGNAQQGIGVSLSADGNVALVGGFADAGGIGAGWVFKRSGGIWTQYGQKFTGSGSIGSANIGVSAALSGDGHTAILGGWKDNSFVGAAWVFAEVSGVWTQMGSKLAGFDAAGAANQGWTVALSGDGSVAMVAAPYDDAARGAAWIYGIGRPQIGSITDVPTDQGGNVRLVWPKFFLDSAGVSNQITSYGIWRKIPAGVRSQATRPSSEMLSVAGGLTGYDYVMTVNAVQIPSYSVVVPTLADSSSGGAPYFTYLLTAHTADPNVYFVSDPDSGYSVDNLSPEPPVGLIASVVTGPQVELQWAAPGEADVSSYRVFRSVTSGFIPGVANMLGTTSSRSFIDLGPSPGVVSYYRVTSVDAHGNVSSPSAEVAAPVSTTRQFSVEANWNMVSVPLRVSDLSKATLYPTATSGAFAYENGYYGYTQLEYGRGYWIKFPSGQSVSMAGFERVADTIDVVSGWNLIGSVSASVPLANIGSIPGGIVTGNFFRYQVGYFDATSLEPGQAYWVKSSQAGQLVLHADGAAASVSRIKMADTGELPPAPPIGSAGELPESFSLSQNYPNPFNPVTSIGYALPADGHVSLKVYDLLGREVATLINEVETAGYKTVSFDAGELPSGVYMYRVISGTFTEFKRMVLLK